jgi:sigma-B regulation protein RsbU (phosphoserine phosphatase)
VANSLTARLVILLTLSISLVLLLLATFEYLASRDRILGEVDRATQRTISDAANNLDNRLTTIEETTKLLAEFLVQDEHSEAEIVALLQQAVDEREDIFGAAIALDPRWSSNPMKGFAAYYFYDSGSEPVYRDLSGAYDYTGRAWYHLPRDRNRAMWSEPYYDTGGGEILMATYSVPVYVSWQGPGEGEAEFYGVVTADIALADIQSYVNGITLGDNGFGFLLSGTGRLMASPDPAHLMKPLLKVLPAHANLAQWGALISEATSGKAGRERMPCSETGGDCLLKLSPLKATGWPLGVYYSEREMLQPLRDYLLKLLSSTLATLALLLLIVVLISRRITRPLTSLANASAKLAEGDFSTPLPPTKRADEVGRLINAFASMQNNLQHHIQALREETATRNRIEGELHAASEIQMAMLPRGGQSSIEEERFGLWARLSPAKSVGGDLYNYKSHDRCLLVAVGDVSDKGVAAALFMARTMTLLQGLFSEKLHVATAMAELNNELTRRNESCMFVTLFLARLNLDTLELEFCSAGHTAPSLLRASQARSVSQLAGPALGLAPDLVFPENTLQLEAGDMLAVYTDGIDEAFNANGEQYGIDRFNQQLEAVGRAPLGISGRAALEAVARHAGGYPQSDDIALLLLRTVPDEFALVIGENGACDAVAWLRQLLQNKGVDPAVHHDLLLLSEEVLTNIEKYAGLEKNNKARLSLQLEPTKLELCFTDPGIAFDPINEAQRATLGENSDTAEVGGLGVHLLEALSDWQSYQRIAGYNVLRLGKQLPEAS